MTILCDLFFKLYLAEETREERLPEVASAEKKEKHIQQSVCLLLKPSEHHSNFYWLVQQQKKVLHVLLSY